MAGGDWKVNERGYHYRYAKGRKEYRHRVVWEEHHGPIPGGAHIHHLDHNPGNNDIGNLAILSGEEHMRYHYEERKRRPTRTAICGNCQQSYQARGYGGKHAKWGPCCRSKMAERTRVLVTRACKVCGTGFRTRNGNFCSQRCVNLGRRDRIQHSGGT